MPVAQLDRVSDSDSDGCRFDPCQAHHLFLSLYLRWIEDPPPKRKAAGSNPVRDASALSRKIFHEIFRVSSNKKEASLIKC